MAIHTLQVLADNLWLYTIGDTKSLQLQSVTVRSLCHTACLVTALHLSGRKASSVVKGKHSIVCLSGESDSWPLDVGVGYFLFFI